MSAGRATCPASFDVGMSAPHLIVTTLRVSTMSRALSRFSHAIVQTDPSMQNDDRVFPVLGTVRKRWRIVTSVTRLRKHHALGAEMRRVPLLEIVDSLEDAIELDPIVKKIQTVVDSALRPRWLRDILHGVPLGHPLHPLAAQVPLGSWVSVAVLDAIPGTDRAACALVGVGVLAAVPTAVAGYNDWSKLHVQQKRVGLVHSAANLLATGLYAVSFLQRVRGKHASGKFLSFAGLAVAAGGGFLGGHLTYRQAAGVNHTEDVLHLFPTGWQPLAKLNDITDGEMEHHIVENISLLVFREADDVHVLSDVCSHLSGPLHEGKIVDGKRAFEKNDPCVECPWHQSVFSLHTGEVIHGPATSAQPRFNTRITNGMVEISLPGADG